MLGARVNRLKITRTAVKTTSALKDSPQQHSATQPKTPMSIREVPSFRPELAEKQIYIIRHAQGQHNVSHSFDYDPTLTRQGLNQVHDQQALAQSLGVDLVLVSPLRRTLQTATGLFPDHPNMVAFEPLREEVMESCNLRLPLEEVSSKFPQVNFDLIEPGPDPHLYRFLPESKTSNFGSYEQLADAYCRIEETDKEMNSRMEQVISFVAAREEKKIALVSHCLTLFALSTVCRKGAPRDASGLYTDHLDNCEIRSLKHLAPETN